MRAQYDISVVMAVYNGERFLRQSIESVLGQTHTNFEFVIVDDGSSDASIEIVESYDDDRIVFLRNEKNIRLPASLNRGISAAKGRLIARMDCDDICFSGRLARQMAFLNQHLDVPAVGSAAIFIDQDGHDVCRFLPSDDPTDLSLIFPGSPFIHPTVMFRRDAFEMAGGYPEAMRWGAEDAVLFAHMARLGPLRNIQQPLLKYRLVPAGASRKPAAYRALLLAMTLEVFETGQLSSDKVFSIEALHQTLDRSRALQDYHFEIAKLILWSGGDRQRLRSHLNESKKVGHAKIDANILQVLSLFPAGFVRRIYRMLKKRRFDQEY